MMPAEIVNLRRFRKARARVEKEAAAAENRSRHGRTRAAKDTDRIDRDKADRHIEGHRRDRPDE